MIAGFLREELGEDFKVMADTGPEQNYLFPPDLATSDLQKEVIIIELTVYFEGAYAAAQERKTAKYLELATEVERKGYNVELITLEVGSRGLVCIDGFQQLRDTVCVGKRKWRQLLQNVAIAAINGSYRIWTSRNHHPQ